MLPNRCSIQQGSLAIPTTPFSNVNYCNSRTPFAIHEILGLSGAVQNNTIGSSTSTSNSAAANQLPVSTHIYCQQNFFDSGLNGNNTPLFPIEMNAPPFLATNHTFDYNLGCAESKIGQVFVICRFRQYVPTL